MNARSPVSHWHDPFNMLKLSCRIFCAHLQHTLPQNAGLHPYLQHAPVFAGFSWLAQKNALRAVTTLRATCSCNGVPALGVP